MRNWPSLTLHFPAGDALQDEVSAALDPDAVAAIEERTPSEWLVSFREASSRDDACFALQRGFASQGLGVEALDVSDEDWARRSQASLGAVRVGRLVVMPPWHDAADREPDTVALIIEPSMGFGSGHHATTRLCLGALQALPLAGARVLDIGTGSGILAIAAALLGAATVMGIDNDPDALESARADAEMNGLGAAVEFAESDFRTGRLAPADVVLANLTGSMLAANAADVAATAAPGGRLILSGITTAEAPAVLDAFAPFATLVWRGDEDGWVGLVLEPRA